MGMKTYRVKRSEVGAIIVSEQRRAKKHSLQQLMSMYDELTQKQKEAINIMAMTQMQLKLIGERDDPIRLLRDASNTQLVGNYFNEAWEAVHWNKVMKSLRKQWAEMDLAEGKNVSVHDLRNTVFD